MVIQAVVDEGDGKSLELHRTNINIDSVKKGTVELFLTLIYATVVDVYSKHGQSFR